MKRLSRPGWIGLLATLGASAYLACTADNPAAPGFPDASFDADLGDAPVPDAVVEEASLDGSGGSAGSAGSGGSAGTGGSGGSGGDDGGSDAAPCVLDAAGSPTIIDAIQASIGTQGVCILRQGGIVECRGTNSTPRPFPADAGAVNVTRVEVGSSFGCMADDASRMWCWGGNPFGQVGVPALLDGSAAPFAEPVLVRKYGGVPLVIDDMAVGFASACVIEHGTRDVYCWGTPTGGEIVDLDASSKSPPAGWPRLAGFKASPTARFTTPRLSSGYCLIDDTSVTCWGNNSKQQLAMASPAAGSTTAIPAAVAAAGGTLPIVDLSMSIEHTCALDSAKRVYCWGGNNLGQNGSRSSNGPTTPKPVLVPELDAGIASVETAAFLTCAVDLQGHAHCFGVNNFGLLGNGDGGWAGGPIPTTVVGPDGGGALEHVVSLATGAVQICAIVEGACGPTGPGPLYCWGNNSSGALWNPDAGNTSAIPVPALAP